MMPENVTLHKNNEDHELNPVAHQCKEIRQDCVKTVSPGQTQDQLYDDEHAAPDPPRYCLEGSAQDLSTHRSRWKTSSQYHRPVTCHVSAAHLQYVPGTLLLMRPSATITAQNFPKPRSGSKATSIKAPVDVSKAVVHGVLFIMPLPRPILFISQQHDPHESKDYICSPLRVLGGCYIVPYQVDQAK